MFACFYSKKDNTIGLLLLVKFLLGKVDMKEWPSKIEQFSKIAKIFTTVLITQSGQLSSRFIWVLIVLGMYNFGLSNVGMDFRFARARGGGLEAANHQTNWIAQQRDLGK